MIDVLGRRYREVLIIETFFRGHHRGDFLGVPATGRPVSLALAIAIDLRDGLLAGERFYWDRAGLAAQLGVDGFPRRHP